MIDLDKVDERTLEKCRESELVAASVVAEAALRLCGRLRKELDEARLINKSYEFKSRPVLKTNEQVTSYTSAYANKYRSPCKLHKEFQEIGVVVFLFLSDIFLT